MCGIFYLGNVQISTGDMNYNNLQASDIYNAFNNIAHRGPDTSTYIANAESREFMGVHRLIINGTNGLSNQPLTLDGVSYLLCNGEIYNHAFLQQKYKINCKSGSDCEIILHLITEIGIENAIRELDGEFGLVYITPNTIYIARDPYGVRALYVGIDKNHNILCIASENKAIYPLLFDPNYIDQFPPGHIGVWDKDKGSIGYYETLYYKYNTVAPSSPVFDGFNTFSAYNQKIINDIRTLLTAAVEKRMMCYYNINNNMNPYGVYLSGGLDSSVVAAILQTMTPNKIETFSIGFEGSPDVYYAQRVAEQIGSNHHEYIITEEMALEAIPEVIKSIESYDVTTVRASVMMYLLAQYINKHSNVVIILSGEGSDEASGSYKYFFNSPSDVEFNDECVRLLKDLHIFDNLRVDKTSAAFGLEARIPFLDLNFLSYYMKIPPSVKTQNGVEKYLIRKAFCHILPECVINRPKEALSDGVSCHAKSWYKIVQAYASQHLKMEDGVMAERQLYYDIFTSFYRGCEHQIPYYWLPKWCGEVKDPSARVLSCYS